jgi:Ca2+-binding RTX toxin-like protein
VVTATGANAAMVDGDKIANFETMWAGSGMDILKGNNLANNIRGGGSDDYIDGGAGNDILFGEGGTDTLSYISATVGVTVNLSLNTAQNTVGAGIDTISGFENLIGTAKADRLLGNHQGNIIEGGGGDDFINGGAGADTLIGGAGINTLTFENSGNITIDLNVQDGLTGQGGVGDAAGDIISGFQNVIGNDAINHLKGNAGVNILKGMGHSDVIQGGGGADTLDGGADVDILNYTSDMAGVTVTLGFNGAQTIGKGGDAEGDKILNFEFIWGGNGKDVLIGNNLSNDIYGGAGDDILDGGAGDDYLNGEGGGNNTASYQSATAGVTVDMNMVGGQQNTVGSGIDTLVDIDSLIGSNKNDVLIASGATVTVDGAGGDDQITGSAIDDILFGGAGNDNIVGGGSQDVLDGGAGNDILDGGTGDQDVLDGGAGNDTINGGVGIADVATYASATSGVTVNLLLSGNAQNTVGAGLDTLIGIERLVGSKFNDTLTGNATANRLDGGEGNDLIVCAGFSDTLIGGLGNDTFRFNTPADAGSSIVDFGVGLDKIQISKAGFGIGASVAINGTGLNNFAAEYFISGAGAVADKAHGQFVFDTDTSRLYWDADGTGGGTAALIVDFDNNHMLLATEFTLI